MIPVMAAVTAGSVGLGVLFNLIGEAEAAGDYKKAQQLREEARKRIEDIKDPELKQVIAEQLGPSAMEGIQGDPALRQAQLLALKKLQDVGNSDGMDAESRQALEQARQEAMRQNQADQQAILSGAAARGMRGSGMAMSAQLQAQQGSADRNALGNINAAGDARRRALQALAQSGQMAGDVRTQDFGEEAAKAKAADAIAAWNANTRQGVQSENNQNELYRSSFSLKKGTASAQAIDNEASGYDAKAGRKKRIWGDAGEGIVKGATGYASGMKDGKWY